MPTLVWKLLRQHISIGQLAGFFLANLFGMMIVLLSVQFYKDVIPVFTEGDSFMKKDFIIATKKISTLGSFAEGGQLKENMEGYYKLIAKRLAQQGVISEIEADSIRPDIQVTGDARNSLAGEKPESSSPTAEEQ